MAILSQNYTRCLKSSTSAIFIEFLFSQIKIEERSIDLR